MRTPCDTAKPEKGSTLSTAEERAGRLAQLPLSDAFPPNKMWRGMVGSWRRVWQRRQLLALLIRREVRAKYKDSILGLGWSLIRPLIQLAIYYVIMGVFLGMRVSIPNFAIFVFTGITLWTLFQEILNTGSGSVLANAGIVKKTQLPREMFPLASVGSALVNFCFQLAILLIAVLATSGFVMSVNFLHFPLAICLVLVWATALAMLLSALNVYFRDIQYLTEVVLLIGFFASPIIYPWNLIQEPLPGFLQEVYLANPITLAVMGAQRVMWNSTMDYAWPSFLAYRMLAALGVGLIVLVLCHRAFSRLQRNFAQEM
jgi:ABC-2 type transport system permease protein